MNGITQLQLGQFLLIYLLLLVVLGVMRVCRIDQTRLLVVSSMKMTVQLILAGLILTYIFEHPHPLFVVAYLGAMTGFSIHRVLSKNRDLNPRFRLVTGVSIAGAGLCVLAYFVALVVGEGLFNPQYVIPIGGPIWIDWDCPTTSTTSAARLRRWCAWGPRRRTFCCPLSVRPWRPLCCPPSTPWWVWALSLCPG